MIANIFKVNGVNIHLGYNLYSDITKQCIEQGDFSLDDMYQSTIVSSFFYPKKNIRIKKKIYKSICKALESIAAKDHDAFINYYYNQSHYNQQAKENISAFLDGVASVYNHLYFRPDNKQYTRFPFGKKFGLCCKVSKKNYIETVIDTDDIECYFGSVDRFFIHFKSGLTVSFNYGSLSVY